MRIRVNWEWYLEKYLLWLGINEGNNSSTGSFNEFNIRSSDVRSVSSITEATGGAVTGMADNSDDRLVVEIRVRRGTSDRWWDTVELSWEKDFGVGVGGEKATEEDCDEEEKRNGVVWHDVGEVKKWKRGSTTTAVSRLSLIILSEISRRHFEFCPYGKIMVQDNTLTSQRKTFFIFYF